MSTSDAIGPRLTPLMAWAILAAASMAAYGWTLGAYFVSDDFGFVSYYLSFPLRSWPELFFRDWSDGIWSPQVNELRPVAALTFIADARLWGVNSGGYHLTNVILHVVCSGMVMAIAARAFGGDRLKALVAGLLFALHPVHREAVVWITGRVDMLAAAGFLFGFYGFLRYREDAVRGWLALAWCGFAFGIFAKESCLILPVVALAYDLPSIAGRRRLQAAAPYVGWGLLIVFYAYCRSFGMDAIYEPERINVWGGVSKLLERGLPYAGAMLFTRDVIFWARYWLEPYAGELAVGGAVTLAALAVWTLARDSRRTLVRSTLFFAVVWPALNAAPLVITYFSLRHLYIVAAGFAIGVTMLLASVWPRRRTFAVASTAVIVLAAAQLFHGMRLWQDAQSQSRGIAETVAEVARQASPGDVLLLDVPASYQGRWVWAWATPFALKPPFQSEDLTRRLIVIERPAVYRQPEIWSKVGALPRLQKADGGWLISAGPEPEVTVRELSAEEITPLLDADELAEPLAFDDLIELVAPPEPQQ